MIDVVGPPTVLLIQEDPERARHIARLLLAEGCEPVAGSDMAPAGTDESDLEMLAARHDARVIICDTPGSVVGKRALLRSLRHVRGSRRCRVVAMTGDPAADADLLLDAGASAVVSVPVRDDELIEAVRQALTASSEGGG